MKFVLDRPIVNPAKIIGDIKSRTSRAFSEIAPIARDDIKKELRSPKSGAAKPARRLARFRLSPARRSATGESLARDTGQSEKLIKTNKKQNNLEVGFLENPFGFNYVAYQELENRRPTIKKSRERTLPKVISIVNRNFKIWAT